MEKIHILISSFIKYFLLFCRLTHLRRHVSKQGFLFRNNFIENCLENDKFLCQFYGIIFKHFLKIYKIHTPSHRSQFKIFAKIRQTFSNFCSNFCKKSRFFDNFHRILVRFWWFFLGISPNILENVEKS